VASCSLLCLHKTRERHVNGSLENQIIYKRNCKPIGQSIIDNPEQLATLRTQDTGRRETNQKTLYNMCWTPLYANKHNYPK
jgi:hypothetical protein